MTRYQQAMTIRCPRCNASKGRFCLSKDRVLQTGGPHLARVRASGYVDPKQQEQAQHGTSQSSA